MRVFARIHPVLTGLNSCEGIVLSSRNFVLKCSNVSREENIRRAVVDYASKARLEYKNFEVEHENDAAGPILYHLRLLTAITSGVLCLQDACRLALSRLGRLPSIENDDDVASRKLSGSGDPALAHPTTAHGV
jgi:hypothetical protein